MQTPHSTPTIDNKHHPHGAPVNSRRRMPIGAELVAGGGAHFRVWAPKAKRLFIDFHADSVAASIELQAESDGYFSAYAPEARAGWKYAYRIDDRAGQYPDPASRFQPEGPHGFSELIDPEDFSWTDQQWSGPDLAGQVLYELHLGTFTPEGTFAAAMRELPALAELGVTLVEIMPVAEFAGNFGWGYDGVDLFAPTRLYGRPNDFRKFVDCAHQLGLGVILDVVYNHFGPTGNYLGNFTDDYLSAKHHTDWGNGINFDSANCQPVREFFTANAGYWIDEFHVDGLRLDAIHAIVDDSPEHILKAIGKQVRKAAGDRKTLVFAENEWQEGHVFRPIERGGYGLDGAWNDDFHHAARVAMTGRSEGYFGDYQGTPQELISAVKWGYLYQGQWNARQKRPRGTPAFDLEAKQFVTFLQNHDQVGNSPRGYRLHQLTSPGRARALTALFLLSPNTPMIFQGQEFAASSPFHYFADHEVELARLVREGRHREMQQFRSMAGPDSRECLLDPCAQQTFEESKLNLSERESHSAVYTMFKDLLRLRRDDPVFAAQSGARTHGTVLSAECFALRFFGSDGDDRLIIVNLGRDLEWRPASEPLLAPPIKAKWQVLWSSENPAYGGCGSGVLDESHSYLAGHAAVVLQNA